MFSVSPAVARCSQHLILSSPGMSISSGSLSVAGRLTIVASLDASSKRPTGRHEVVVGWQSFLPANRSIDPNTAIAPVFNGRNAAPVPEATASSARNILMVDIHPPQPHQAYASAADAAREGEAEVGSGLAGLEVVGRG